MHFQLKQMDAYLTTIVPQIYSIVPKFTLLCLIMVLNIVMCAQILGECTQIQVKLPHSAWKYLFWGYMRTDLGII